MKMTEVKKRKNSRAKGASFERKIAKDLTAWWGDSFTKTPSSGGLRWGQDHRVTGDIVPSEDAKDFPFVVECKKRENWDFEQIIKGTGEVPSWWEQAYNDNLRLGDHKKTPILIFSKNRSPVYFMVLKTVQELLKLDSVDYFETTIAFKDLQNGTDLERKVYIGLLGDLMKLERSYVVSSLSF